MQARGYRYLDANKLSQNLKRIMVIAPFEKFWVIDGEGAAPEDNKILSEQKSQENSSDSHGKRYIIRYKVLKDASGELMKDSSGNYIFAPVYDEEQQETASLR